MERGEDTLIQLNGAKYKSVCNSRILSPNGNPIHLVMAGNDIIYPEKYLPYRVVLRCDAEGDYHKMSYFSSSITYTIDTAFPCYVRQFGGEEIARNNNQLSKDYAYSNNLKDIWIVTPYCTDMLDHMGRWDTPSNIDYFLGMDTLLTITNINTGQTVRKAFTLCRFPYDFYHMYFYAWQGRLEYYAQRTTKDPILEKMYPGESIGSFTFYYFDWRGRDFCSVTLPDGTQARCFVEARTERQSYRGYIPKFYNGDLDISYLNSLGYVYQGHQVMNTTLLFNNNPLYLSYNEWQEDVRDKSKFPRQPTIEID
jgi:hypothetical protein